MTGEERLAGAEKRLGTYGRFSAAPGTGGVSALLSALGDPHRALRFVHVAGTNGKGSTTSMIASGLSSAGYRTGLYTSPSVERLTERVCIGMEEVPPGEFAAALEAAMDAADRLGLSPAQFDVLTAAAFMLFRDKGCEIVCAEVGLGGRLDATNVIESPEVSVITSVSSDHVAQLGSDLRSIAREKCGIIKKGCPVVSYPLQQAEVAEEIRDCAGKSGSPLKVPDLGELGELREGPEGSEFVFGGQRFSVTMPGRHFVMNALTAIEAMKVLRERGWALSCEDVVRGVAARPLSGRLQILLNEPLLIADGAHNPDAAEKLAEAMTGLFPGRRLITVMGMYSDKDHGPCVAAVAGISDVFIATEPQGERARPATDIWEAARGRAERLYICPTVRSALMLALAFYRPGDAVLCCGSFAMASEIKKILAKYAPYVAQFTK